MISFLSPRVLPLVPAYVSYIAGESVQRRRRLHARERLMTLGIAMVAGQLTVISNWLLRAFPALGAIG